MPFEINNAWVVGVGSPCIHHIAFVGPGPGWLAGGGVADFLATAGAGVDHVVGGAALVGPWSLNEPGQAGRLNAAGVADHIFVQFTYCSVPLPQYI